MRTAIVLSTLLILGVAIPSVNATQSREIECISSSPTWTLLDQECMAFSLGSVVPGETHLIQFQTDNEVDVLIFSQAGYSVYSNDQSYRASNVWDEVGSLESINGSAEWRWTAPSDKSQTNWYLIIDNLDHLQDDDEGANGGYSASGSITIESATIRSWTLHDTLWSLDSDEGLSVAGPFSFQEGTQVLIEALEIDGAPDVFFMTEQQKDLYLQDTTNDFRVPDTDLLSITTSSSRSWLVPEVHSNQPLYLMVDNTASPTGGGSGTTPARLGVILSILPILDAEISSPDNLLQVDVRQTISLSTSNTPNDWNQLDPSGYSWSAPNASCSSSISGSSVSLCWTSEGQKTVQVTVSSIDGRTDTESVTVNVVDSTPPSSEILVSGDIVRGVGESFTISGRSSDNGEVVKEEWLIDGIIVQSENQSNTSLTYSFDTAGDIGSHIITLRVIDSAGLTSQTNVSIEVADTTSPVTSTINGTEIVNPGDSVTFSITATDPESSTLVFEWDLDGSVDSDSNGISDDDVDMTGASITTIYQTGGSRFVSCTVTNEAGSSTTERFTVTVLNPQQEETSSSTSFGMIAIIALALILIIAAIGAFFWQRTTARRVAEIVAEQEAAKNEQIAPPTVEEQAQMYASRRSTDDFESIAGMSSSQLGNTSSSRSVGSTAVLDDLISDDDNQKFEIETAKPTTPKERTKPSNSPTMLGIEIPIMDTSPAAPEPSVSAAETINSTCSSCGKDFEVDLPPGISSGKTACPHCGSIEMVER